MAKTVTERSVRHLPILSTSSMKAYRGCPRLYQLAYLLGFRSVHVSEALTFGTLWHLLLEAWWNGLKSGVRGDELLARAIAAGRAAFTENTDPFVVVKLETLMVAYHAYWEETTARCEVLHVEVQFSGPIVSPVTGAASKTYQLGGKIDAIVRQADGEIWLIEHKTTSDAIEAGSSYWRKLQLDSQISNYFTGGNALGLDIKGCVYDVLSKPTIKPSKATPMEKRKYKKTGELYANQREFDETPAEFGERLQADLEENVGLYFKREGIVRLDSERRGAAFDLWQGAKQIRESERTGMWPRNPDYCDNFGSLCSFFGVCTGVSSLEDEMLFRRQEWKHPELEPEPDVQAAE